MWFLFGLGSMIGFIILMLYWKFYYVWSGSFAFINKIRYEYLVIKNKKTPEKLLIGIDCHYGNNFQLKFETSDDRFFKKLGLVNEHQISNETFNNKIYIVSDNDKLNRFFSSNNKIVDDILKLFKDYQGFYNLNEIKELRLFQNKLWVEFRVNKHFEFVDMEQIVKEVIPLLESIKNSLQISKLPRQTWKNDPFLLKSIVILGVSSGLLLTGIFYIMRIKNIGIPFNIDDFYTESLILGIGIIIVLMFLTVFLLKNSSRVHLVLFELLFTGIIGSIVTSYMLFSDLNMSLDTSKAKFIKTKIVSKYISRSTKRPNSYYIYLQQWYGNKNERKEIKVSREVYRLFNIDERVTIVQKNGFFNKRWVEDVLKESGSF